MKKKRILITLPESKIGGPYVCHSRIMNSSLKEKYEFIPFYIPRIRKLIRPKVFLSLVKKIREISPDIYHFYGLQLDGFFSLLLARRASKKIPTVLVVHGSSSEAVKIRHISKFLINTLERYTLKKSTISYGVSEYVSNWEKIKKIDEKYYGRIYNFLPEDYYDISEEEKKNLRKKLGIKTEDIVITSTGRIIKEKGFEELKDIINYDDYGDNIVFMIVGSGSYLDEMKENIISKKARTIFVKYNEDVNKFLSISNIFITFTWHETLGNSLFEAALKGLPVISTNVGGVPELITEGVNGYLFNLGDISRARHYIKKLIKDKELRELVGNKTIDDIKQKLDTNTIIKQITEVYEKVTVKK